MSALIISTLVLRRVATALTCVGVGVVLLFALSSCPRDLRGRDEGETVDSLPGEDFIRIGVAVPLSGPTAGFGSSIQRGIDFAVQELNDAGGIYKKKFLALYEDTEGKAPFADSLTRKLVDVENADFLIGSASSTETMEMAKVAEELKVPLLVPVATNPGVTVNEDGTVRRYVFRVCFTDDLQGMAIARFVAKDLAGKEVAILWDNGSAYSSHLREVIVTELQGESPAVKVVADESYIGGGLVTSFKPTVDRLFAKRFNVLILPAYYEDAVGIIQEVRSRGSDVLIIGGDGLASYEFLRKGGSFIEGVYFTNHFSIYSTKQRNKAFVDEFHQRYETMPDAFSALSYDAVNLLAEAIRSAQTLDREAVRDALHATKGYSGITGTITIDEFHNARKSVLVEKVEGLKFKFVREITPKEIEEP